MIILARIGLLAAVIGGSSTCDDDARITAPVCGEDGCPTDQRCENRACVGETGPVYPITLRILPTDDTLAPVELADLRFASMPVLSLSDPVTLEARVPVTGQVIEFENGEPRSLPVRRVVVEPVGGISAQPLIAQGVISANNLLLFTFSLTPFWPRANERGAAEPSISPQPVAYRVRAALRGLPPWEAELDWDTISRDVVVRVPSTANMPGIQGVVRVNDLPLRDVRVYARDTVTGRQLSSDGVTDESGAFSVRLWPTVGEIPVAQSVDLAFVSANPARPLPSHSIPVTTPASGFAAPIRVDLPEPGPSVRTTIRVGQPQGDTRTPLAGVEVQLRRAFASGVHSVRGRTDAAGEFSTLIFPGEYVVDLAPSAGSPLRLSRLRQSLDAGLTELTARPRTAISGAVLDADARPVANARIEATLLEARYADETLSSADEAPPYRIFETRTDATGQFLLSLDPGRHRLLITPPETSGLPPFIELLEFQGDQPRTDLAIALPPAAVVSGVLVDSDGETVDSAFVEVWVEGEPPFQLTRGQTTTNGRFNLRLPVRLQTP